MFSGVLEEGITNDQERPFPTHSCRSAQVVNDQKRTLNEPRLSASSGISLQLVRSGKTYNEILGYSRSNESDLTQALKWRRVGLLNYKSQY